MPNVNSPLALQSLLGDISSRRAIAMALRAREGSGGGGEMVSGRYVPNLRAVGGALSRGLFGDPLDALRQEEQGALQSYGDELAGATEGILGGENEQDNAAFAKTVARAQTAGVNPDLVKSTLDRRQSWQILNQMLAGLGAPAVGVAAGGMGPGAGVRGAPGAGQPPIPPAGGAPGAGGGPPMPPQAAQAGPGGDGEPQTGAEAFSRAIAPRGAGTPLTNVPMGHLLTLAAVVPKGTPAAELVAKELGGRKVEIGRDGFIVQNGQVAGQMKDGIFTDASGKAWNIAGAVQAEQAGQKAGAEARAKAPYNPVTVQQGRQQVTTFAPQIPGYGQQGGAPAAGGQPPANDGRAFNYRGTVGGAQAALGAIASDQAAPAGGGGFPLGTGADPLDTKAAEARIGSEAAGRTKLFEGQSETLNKGLETARQAAEVNLPAIDTVRGLLDSGKVKTGMGASFSLQFGRALSASGLSDGDGVAATQAFVAQSAKRVMGVIKMLGSGSGISDADREYAAKAVGGNIAMDEKSIRRILDIDERAQRAYITSHNRNVERASSLFQSPDQKSFYLVDVPGAAAAAPAVGGKTVKWSDLP